MSEDTSRVSDEEIAAAVGDELPDRAAMSVLTSGCGPEEFGLVADSVIPPGESETPTQEPASLSE